MAPGNQTERLYYSYVSASPYKAGILKLKSADDGRAAVFLDKTIFYPEGGGQPGDRGIINGVHLLDVKEKDGEILHLISASDAEKLKPGPAELILDVRRRRDLTALHTGQHLLSATLLRLINAPTVSMHMGDEACTIDVDIAEISEKTLLAVEEAVADAIEENHPVIIHPCPPEDILSFPLRKVPPKGEEVIRIVEIEGHDFIACCGTHLKSTAEIGLFRILGTEKYKGMNRISFLAGRRLLNDCLNLRHNALVVSRAISVPVNDIGNGVLEYLEKAGQMEKRLKVLESKAIQEKAEALIRRAAGQRPDAAKPAGSPVIVIESFEEDDIHNVLSIGKLVQKYSAEMFILVSEPDLKFSAFCRTEGFDLRLFIKDAMEAQGGRGGGSNSLFQGSFGTKEALDAFIAAINNKKV